MLSRSQGRCSRYIPVVGRAFLVESLYGSKYSPHIGTYHMPYVYVKTLLLCATGKGLSEAEARHIHGLVEALLPSTMSEENLTKLELMQFVDSVPLGLPAGRSEAQQVNQSNTAKAADKERGDGDGARENVDNEDDGDTTAPAAATSSPDPLAPSSSDATRGGAGPSADGVAELAAAVSFIGTSSFPANIARILMYDAVSACLADGVYSSLERERVALVAAQIGLSSAVREEIEWLVAQECVIALRKRALLNLSPSPSQSSSGEDRQRHHRGGGKEEESPRDGRGSDDERDSHGTPSGASRAQETRRRSLLADFSPFPHGGNNVGSGGSVVSREEDSAADAQTYVNGVSNSNPLPPPPSPAPRRGRAKEGADGVGGVGGVAVGEHPTTASSTSRGREWDRLRRAKALLRAARAR